MPKNKQFSGHFHYQKQNVKKTAFKKINNRNNNGGGNNTTFTKSTFRKNVPATIFEDDELLTKANRKELEFHFGWHRVVIFFGSKYDRTQLLEKLTASCAPLVLKVYSCQCTGSQLSFYIDNSKLAHRLRALSKHIIMPDNRHLEIRVYAGLPRINLTNHLKEAIKVALTNRYDVSTQALNLSQFYTDNAFEDNICCLFNVSVMEVVFKLIVEHVPTIKGLNLSQNHIRTLSHMSKYTPKLTMLNTIDVSNNGLTSIEEFKVFAKLPIVTIQCDHNPFEKRFVGDAVLYKNEMRKIFPRLLCLNNIKLPPPLNFNIENNASELPKPNSTFLAAADAGPTVKLFLEQYFDAFDNNRETLLHAYETNCQFSFCISYADNNDKAHQCTLRAYYSFDRNMIRFTDNGRKLRCLKEGKLQTVTLLSEFPKTKHDLSSITLDVILCTANFIQLVVVGNFEEVETNTLRYFSRNMIIVPFGSGVCIVNEMMHVTHVPTDFTKTII